MKSITWKELAIEVEEVKEIAQRLETEGGRIRRNNSGAS